MKAVCYDTYGPPDVLHLQEVPEPVPGDGEVLVEVHAASVNYADWAFLRGTPAVVRLMGSGLFRPKNRTLGSDISGRVVGLGKGVTTLEPGNEVFGDISGCGWGGFAEYVCARAEVLAPKPGTVSHEEAAAFPQAAVTALQGLRDKGRVACGKRVLIHGASGGIGTFAIQIARAYGAEVTAVCSARSAETVRSIGAERVIDYAREDFAADGERYDLIMAIAGDRPLSDYMRALARGGVYVCVGGSGRQLSQSMFLGPWVSMAGSRKITALSASPNASDLLTVRQLAEEGKLAAVIDRSYPLAETADALRHYGERHTRGKIVVRVRGNERRPVGA